MFVTYETGTDPNPSRLHATRTRYKNGETECKLTQTCGVNQTDQVIPSETDIDDVVQVNNVFINVSKGEVAKTEDLKKAFGKADREAILREVTFTQIAFTSISLSRFEFRFFNEARFRLGTRSASMSFPPCGKKSPP